MNVQSKVCTKCGIEKPIGEYGIARGTIRKANCKACVKIESTNRKRTKDGVVQTIYNGQVGSSKKRGHAEPTYTKEELKDWLFGQKEFHVMYDNWKRLDYQTKYKPSVDRKDDNIGYTMANIQLMSFGENNKKAGSEAGLSHNSTPVRPVKQYDLSGSFIAEYSSIAIAGRTLGIKPNRIAIVCIGYSGDTVRLQADGFQFRYAEEACDYIGACPSKKWGSKITIQEELDRRKQYDNRTKDN